MPKVSFRGRESTPRALEDERCRAWGYYRAVLRGRAGREYEELEPLVWAELQGELAALDAQPVTTRLSRS
jgi:hypothetical protein